MKKQINKIVHYPMRLFFAAFLVGAISCGFWGCESRENRSDQSQLSAPLSLQSVVEFKEGNPEEIKPYLPSQFKVSGLTLSPADGDGYTINFDWTFGYPKDLTRYNYMVDWTVKAYEVNQEAAGRESLTELREMDLTVRVRPSKYGSQKLVSGKRYRFELEGVINAYPLKGASGTVVLAKVDFDARSLPKTAVGKAKRYVEYPIYTKSEVSADHLKITQAEQALLASGWRLKNDKSKDLPLEWDKAFYSKYKTEHPTTTKAAQVETLERYKKETAFFHAKYSGPYYIEKPAREALNTADLKNFNIDPLTDPSVWVEATRAFIDDTLREIEKGKFIL